MRSAAIPVLAAALCASCSTPPAPAHPARTFDVRAAAARLALPPDEATRAALDDLRAEARGGDDAARLARALYLLDLFDHARFGGAAASRRLLFEELGGAAAAPGGALATEWAVQRLDAELARSRAAADAAAARALLAIDAPAPGGAPLQLLAPAKRLARDGSTDLRANALLRLYGFCARALRDATRAPVRERARVANHCLYALYDSDPSAYFAEDPALRPPDPPWTAYRDGLARLLEELRRSGTRVAGLAERLAEADRRFFAEAAPAALPLPLDPAALRLPADPAAPPWDHAPLVRVGADGVSLGGRPIVDDTRLRAELAGLVAGDPERRLTVVTAADEPARRVVRLAEAAFAAGVRVLELGVAQPVQLMAPAGDYWAGRPAVRLAVIPLALAPLGPAAAAGSRERARAALWDPARDELGLTLGADAELVLSARDGVIARLPAGDAAALRQALRRVRRAFPDQSALALYLGDRPRYRDLVALAQAAARDERGAALMPALGLVAAPPRARGSLEARVARRAAAEVSVAVAGPPATAARFQALAPQLRRCLLPALDRNPRLTGALVYDAATDGHGRLTLRQVAASGDAALRACVRERLEQAGRGGAPTAPVSGRVTVQLQTAP